MNIKEMEGKTGMTRANIRYYEAEGLIFPQRRENGYREYTQADCETLLKIKLLRSMDISLDTIRKLQAGEVSLRETAQAQARLLSQRKETLARTLAAVQRLGAGFGADLPGCCPVAERSGRRCVCVAAGAAVFADGRTLTWRKRERD